MPLTLWRIFAWLGIGLTAVSVAGDLIFWPPSAVNGFDARGDGAAQVVTRVAPGSAAAEAGLAPGDRLSLADNDLVYRIRFATTEKPGETLPLLVDHQGQTRRVVLVARAQQSKFGGLGVAYELIRLVLIALAALVVLRQSDRPFARSLAGFYIAFAFGFLGRPPWYGEGVRLALSLSRPAAFVYALAALAHFAATFPTPSATGFRRHLPRIATIIGIAGGALFAAGSLVPIVFGTGFRSVLSSDAVSYSLALMLLIAQLACVAAGFVIGAREANAADRPRLRWLALSFTIGFAGLMPAVALEAAGVPESSWFLLPLTLVAIPIGSTYAILRHRLIDVGFVINRAIVFAIISGLIVFSFSILEFVLGKYLTRLGNVQSSVLEAALALGIALSLGRLHGWVDHVVDATFFRKRHLAELALRRLTRETAHVSDSDVLGARVVAAAVRHAELEFATIFLGDSEGVYRARWSAPGDRLAPNAVDDNDATIVRLRTFREPVDLRELADEGAPSSLDGALAFPLLVRGELLGTMVCGPKRDDEALAPDESATLADLALATGVALDTLRTTALRRAVARALTEEDGLEALREANAVFGLLPPSPKR